MPTDNMKTFYTLVLDNPKRPSIEFLNADGKKNNWDDVTTLWTDDFDKCAKFNAWDVALTIKLRLTTYTSPYIHVKSFKCN